MAKAKKKSTKKSSGKRATKKKSTITRKNKPGVKNSLVNNINARKKKGISRSKKKSSISKKAYDDMEENWSKEEK